MTGPILQGSDYWQDACLRLEKEVLKLQDRVTRLEQVIDYLEGVSKPVEFPGVDPNG